MLNAPGAARNRPTPRSNRRKNESPEEQIRALQRINKTCADCSTKLPQCVNLTLGTFVCMACSGIHRELNMRVKGIGASTFTQEEVDKLRETSNDQVNAVYLARYNPRFEKLQQPINNYDQQALRLWIRRKYNDKAWYGMDPQPTRVDIPPKQETKSPPADLLAFSGSSNPPAPPNASQKWNAFNGASQLQQQESALPEDFGSSHTKQQQGFAAFGQQPPPQQQQHFGAFGQATQQNFAAFDQQQPPQQQNFAAFGGPQQQNAQFVNFHGQPMQQVPQQPQQFGNNFAQVQPPPAQHPGQFSGFGQQPSMSPQQLQFVNSAQASLQQPQNQFTSYGQQQPLQPSPPMQNQGMMTQNNPQLQQASGSFATFPQQGLTASLQATPEHIPPMPPPEVPGAPPSLEGNGDRISDAFSNLGTPSSLQKEAAPAPEASKEKSEPKHASGDSVVYANNGDKLLVKILKVHLDDALEPFYTIQLPDGREKQTDDAHLSSFVETSEVKEVTSMLVGLDVAQLKEVIEFIKKLKCLNGSVHSTASPSMPASSIQAPLATGSLPVSSMPPEPDMAPPVPPISPPATVPTSTPSGFAGGAMGVQAAASIIPSQSGYSHQMQSDAMPMGGIPAPPIFQQQGLGPSMPQQQQYMQQQLPPQQQQPALQQHGQQQLQQAQHQYGHLHHPQEQIGHQQPQSVQQQFVQQQYMQQHSQFVQQVPHQMPGAAPMSPKGNPFDMYS